MPNNHARKRPRPQDRNSPATPAPGEPLRIAKAMARAGLCSRREAERWIGEGRVSVNGKVLTKPAFEVGGKDRVLVDGKPLPVADTAQLWRYYKPKGLVTTHSDPQGRPTVFSALPPELPRVISVGRLDFNSEGLLLLTNSGALARHLELPSTGWLRRYRVRAYGRVPQAQLDALRDGIEIEGVRYGPIEARIDSVQGANAWLTMGLREGRNREPWQSLSHGISLCTRQCTVNRTPRRSRSCYDRPRRTDRGPIRPQSTQRKTEGNPPWRDHGPRRGQGGIEPH